MRVWLEMTQLTNWLRLLQMRPPAGKTDEETCSKTMEEIKAEIKRQSVQRWDKAWSSCYKGRFLYDLQPFVVLKPRIIRSNRGYASKYQGRPQSKIRGTQIWPITPPEVVIYRGPCPNKLAILQAIFWLFCRQGDTKIHFLGGRGTRSCIRVHSMGVLLQEKSFSALFTKRSPFSLISETHFPLQGVGARALAIQAEVPFLYF